MYEKAFDGLQFGYGSAVAFALFALIVIFSIFNYLLVRRSVRN
jgi:cellobiose transport system permease protein